MSPGPTQLIIVLVIVLLLFGAKKIPELAKGLGSGMREFRRGASGELEEDKNEESKSEKEPDSEGRDDAGSEDKLTYASDEDQKSQNADKTEQRS